MGYSVEEVLERFELEGTAYAVQHYLDVDKIEDIVLREACVEAKNALDKLDRIAAELERESV